jgi:hypothetical protein
VAPIPLIAQGIAQAGRSPTDAWPATKDAIVETRRMKSCIVLAGSEVDCLGLEKRVRVRVCVCVCN